MAKWHVDYVRFWRWAELGVGDAMNATLVDLRLTGDWQHMMDSTIVCGHSQAAGAKGAPIKKALIEAAATSRAKSTSAVTVRGALGVVLTGGDASDYRGVFALLDMPLAKPKVLLADKGYDGAPVREGLLRIGILQIVSTQGEPSNAVRLRLPTLPRLQLRRAPVQPTATISTQRARYDTTATFFPGFLSVAAGKLWLTKYVNKT
ncbi:transposase [Sphingomonas sp. PAMC 26605]|uniref:transposase n=1 Tax=Sphingomonas sp. PAMC 26605 TaxID=1112214 RepID=UPI00026CB5C7|nr:transposase [Sphingomonas sp. PAMC 26605]